MLVLTRGEGQEIKIGKDVTIKVTRLNNKTVRLGITAPADMSIIRGELEANNSEIVVETEVVNL